MLSDHVQVCAVILINVGRYLPVALHSGTNTTIGALNVSKHNPSNKSPWKQSFTLDACTRGLVILLVVLSVPALASLFQVHPMNNVFFLGFWQHFIAIRLEDFSKQASFKRNRRLSFYELPFAGRLY